MSRGEIESNAMVKLHDATVLMGWKRGIAAVNPGLPTVWLDADQREQALHLAYGESLNGDADALRAALGEHLSASADGDGGPIREALAEADRRVAGWLPGWDRYTGQLDLLQRMHARRRMICPGAGSRPTLPSSALRRYLLVEPTGEHVVLLGDTDGVSILLAGAGHRVTVFEPDGAVAKWLSVEAATQGATVEVINDPAALPSDADCAVVTVGPLPGAEVALHTAAGCVKTGGSVAVRFRAPWEIELFDRLDAAGFSVKSHLRDFDTRVLPGGRRVDWAGDLAIFTTPSSHDLRGDAPSAAENTRGTHFTMLDIECLPAERLDPEAPARLLDTLARAAPRPEFERSVSVFEDTYVLCWYDAEGYGFSARLARHKGQLAVNLCPYIEDLESPLLWAVLETLGDEFTRVPPVPTRKWKKERVFG